MRVAFLVARKDRELAIAGAFLAGVARRGDQAIAVELETGDELPPAGTEIAVMFGVKSRERFEAVRRAGMRAIYLDKGYSDRGRLVRVAIDAHQPTSILERALYPSDRWNRWGIEVKPWRRQGEAIVIAGSSEKYHAFHGLPHPTEYAAGLVGELRRRTDRRIIYRPKPSWQAATPIDGADFRPDGALAALLAGAWCLVTHGSNACFDAMVAGVPSIVLGDGIARPISSTSLDDVDWPRLAPKHDRRRLLANLAYCQWSIDELDAGQAWQTIRAQLDHA